MKRPKVSAGDILGGKYRVERILGEGGMGVVVAATHVQLGERVALKFLLPELAGDKMVVARFLREARAAVRIKSEHIARASDVGLLDNGSPYMVMEYLKGSDLAMYLQARGPLPIAEAVGYVLQAGEAVAEAHALGMVHRDLKPANLFLTHRNDGSPLIKVLDFGISKAVEVRGETNLTATSTMMGSPAYMSPEQIRNAREVDPRADVWSLGIILQELMTAAPVFNGESVPAMLASIMTDRPTRLSALRPDAPGGLQEVIDGCLEKNASSRTPNVAALARALLPFGPPEGAVSVERICSMLEESGASTATTLMVASGERASALSRSASRRLRRTFVAVSALALLAAATASAALLLGRPPPASGQSAPVASPAASASLPPSASGVAPGASAPVGPLVEVTALPAAPPPASTTSAHPGGSRPGPGRTAPPAPPKPPKSGPGGLFDAH